MIYRYIYKITCTAGSFKDKFYFGQHTTENLDDNYHGSGHKLLSYLKKYPNDYIKEVISFYDTEEELNKAEYDIIHPYLGSEMCLNINEGGYYGKPSYETRKKISESNIGREPWNKGKKGIQTAWNKGLKNWMSDEGKKSLSEKIKNRPPTKGFTGHHFTEYQRANISNGMKNSEKFQETMKSQEYRNKLSESLKGKNTWSKGSKRSEETKKKQSEARKLWWANKKQK